MFASTYEALGTGDLLLIFPEGVTQDVPHMAEFKTRDGPLLRVTATAPCWHPD